MDLRAHSRGTDRINGAGYGEAMPQVSVRAKRAPRQPLPRKPAASGPLLLEDIPPGSVEALNAFYRDRSFVQISIAGEAGTITAAWPSPAAADDPETSVAFTLGDASGEVCLPRTVFERWLAKADEALKLERLAPDHAALLLESFLTGEVAWLEEQLGQPIAIHAIETSSVEKRRAPPGSIGFLLAVKEEVFRCTLSLNDVAGLTRLGLLLKNHGVEAQSAMSGLFIPLSVCRGAVTVSIGALQSLAAGDVVLFDETEREMDMGLVIGGRFAAPVRLTAGGVKLAAAPVAIAGSKWEWIMDQKTASSAQALDGSGLDEILVILVFELSRTSLPLGEVRQLGPGAIVPLADVARETVSILANGKQIGQGEIVRIGESLGVRITGMSAGA